MENKDFTQYTEALELKQLGFQARCFGHYWENLFYFETTFNHPSTMPNSPESCLTPTYSQAFRWFRKEYALESYIRANLCVDVPKTYQFNIDDNIDDVWYDTYEEAELACLKKLIEIVKGGNK